MKTSWKLYVLLLATGCLNIENKNDQDNDGDGFTEFDGDCDDTDPFTFPGAAENERPDDCTTDADEDGMHIRLLLSRVSPAPGATIVWPLAPCVSLRAPTLRPRL